jgi:hypothetical protein
LRPGDEAGDPKELEERFDALRQHIERVYCGQLLSKLGAILQLARKRSSPFSRSTSPCLPRSVT